MSGFKLAIVGDYFSEEDGTCPAPASITAVELRGFLSALHEAGYAKTSIARKLASLRSFYRFGQREAWVKSNPARALRNPRKGRSLPHFLTTADIGKLLAAPPAMVPLALVVVLHGHANVRQRGGRHGHGVPHDGRQGPAWGHGRPHAARAQRR